MTRPGNIRDPRAGMTLVELIVAFTILLALTSMAVPLARSNVRRHKERDLRNALQEIRKAIDKYSGPRRVSIPSTTPKSWKRSWKV